MTNADPTRTTKSTAVDNIDIDLIRLARRPLRTEITPESIRALADSIQTDGLLQPIVVTANAEGGWNLIAGRRRLEAFRQLGRQTIPCLIIETPDIEEIPALAENLMRTNMSVLEEARALAVLHEKKGLSLSELAERTHHSECWVRDRIALLSLPENMQAAVDKKHLSIGAAQQLYLITDTPLRDFYVELAIRNGASVNQCQAWYEMWRATQQLTCPDGIQQPTLYPPPPTPTSTIYCWAGEHRVPEPGAITVHICADCQRAINDAKAGRTGYVEDPDRDTPSSRSAAEDHVTPSATDAPPR